MAEALIEILARLVELACIKDLFRFVKVDQETTLKYRSVCQRVSAEEKLVVDLLAFYDPEAKMIVFCAHEFERAVRMFRIDSVGCYEVFALYVLLHEFTHYVIDVLGLRKWLLKLEEPVRFDEPFCEYIALRTLATGVYKAFAFERRLCSLPRVQECLPFISSLPRPHPYSLFKDLYAIPNDIFRMSAECVFLSMLSATIPPRRPPVAIEKDSSASLRVQGSASLPTASLWPHPRAPFKELYETPSDKFYMLLFKDLLKSGEPKSLLRLALLARLSRVNVLEQLASRAPEALNPVEVTAV